MAEPTYDLEFRSRRPTLPGIVQLAREGFDGAGWYDLAGAQISAWAVAHEIPFRRVVDLLAICSPRVSVAKSVSIAQRYLLEGDLQGTLPSTRAAIAHYEATGQIRGPKTAAFARALAGDRSAVVVDVWIARALQIDEASLSSIKVYKQSAQRIRGACGPLGLCPRDVQAAIWRGTRMRYGFKHRGDLVLVV